MEPRPRGGRRRSEENAQKLASDSEGRVAGRGWGRGVLFQPTGRTVAWHTHRARRRGGDAGKWEGAGEGEYRRSGRARGGGGCGETDTPDCVIITLFSTGRPSLMGDKIAPATFRFSARCRVATATATLADGSRQFRHHTATTTPHRALR